MRHTILPGGFLFSHDLRSGNDVKHTTVRHCAFLTTCARSFFVFYSVVVLLIGYLWPWLATATIANLYSGSDVFTL